MQKGGSLQGCYSTDEAVIPDLQQMLRDLDGPVVPAQYQAANSTIRTGLQDDVAALRMRDDAIKTNNDAEFTSARSKALAAARELEAGYAQFPAAASPPDRSIWGRSFRLSPIVGDVGPLGTGGVRGSVHGPPSVHADSAADGYKRGKVRGCSGNPSPVA